MAEEEERFVPPTSLPSGLPEGSGKGDGCFRGAADLAASELPSAAASLYAYPQHLGQGIKKQHNLLLPQYNMCNALYLISGSLT